LSEIILLRDNKTIWGCSCNLPTYCKR